MLHVGFVDTALGSLVVSISRTATYRWLLCSFCVAGCGLGVETKLMLFWRS